ncbi:MAG: polysaccharide biosynthesis protein PslG [Solirubrobacteraceae bacterium]|nr:polysaccharide biosynthesis protein PslG [Solirubrobacteraceae bacterium]
MSIKVLHACPAIRRVSATPLKVRLPRFAAALMAAGAVATILGVASPPVFAIGSEAVGIYSEELEAANSADPLATAAAIRDAGAGMVREPFSWARIETAPGHLDFSVYDTVMTAAASAGLKVLPVVMDPPAWRSTAPATGALRAMYPPSDVAAMAALATALVQRYGPGGSFWASHPELSAAPIHSWQVWNEPNIPAFWATGPDPAGYVRMLRAVGAAIHAADPYAEVVTGGLPYAGAGIPVAQFVDGMYAAGARGTFDTLAIHPYAANPAGVLEILRLARAQLDRLGDPQRFMRATEFGWATGGPPVTITASEPAQAALLRDTLAALQQARGVLRLRGYVVFRWKDVGLNPGQADVWALHTGLLREDGTPKPALAAFRGEGVAAAAVWPSQPTAAQNAIAAAALEQSAMTPGQLERVAGVSRRSLQIRRRLSRDRLLVTVVVPSGGGAERVRIAYSAVRRGHVVARGSRRAAARNGVARAAFKLPRAARRTGELRITAQHGSARATRLLSVHARRNVGAR